MRQTIKERCYEKKRTPQKSAKTAWVAPTVVGVSIPLHAQATTNNCLDTPENTYIQVTLLRGDFAEFPQGITVRFLSDIFDITKVDVSEYTIPPPGTALTGLYVRDLPPNTEFTGPVEITIEHPAIVTMKDTVNMTTIPDECGLVFTGIRFTLVAA